MESYIFEPLVTALSGVSLLFHSINPNICEYESSIINGFINPYIDYRWYLVNMAICIPYLLYAFVLDYPNKWNHNI